jgi:hypothetical protein
MRVYTPMLLLLALVEAAFARAVREPPVPKLFELAHLVLVGEVTGIRPFGITTTLSYPTLQGVTYQWLRVDVSVYGILKGTNAGHTVSVAVLAPLSGTSLGDDPAMVSPKKGDSFIFFLAPSSVQPLYASMLAPYDEANAILPLDRHSPAYDFSGIVSKDYLKHCQEKKALAWALVDWNNNFLPKGLDAVRTKYKKEIQTPPQVYKITLEWKSYTNAQGWSWDVPKDSKVTSSEPGAAPNAAPPRR